MSGQQALPAIALLDDDLLELNMLADMVLKLSSSERGVQQNQGERIAERLRACRGRLANWKHLGVHRSSAVSGKEASFRGDDNVQASTTENHTPVRGQQAPPQHLIPGALNTTTTLRVPQPPSAATDGGTPRRQAPMAAALSSSRGASHAPQPAASMHTQSITGGFKVLKPSSIRVAQVSREQAPTSSAAISKDVGKYVSAAIYNVLESVANLTGASSAHVFLREGSEMVSIANVGQKLSFPPKLVRQSCQGSLAAGVMSSGIAVNQRVLEASNRSLSTSTLAFPVRSRFGGGVNNPILGVVQVNNKHGGPGCFSEVDENVVNIAGTFIGELMSKFPIDWSDAFYDPITQHKMAPFAPRGYGNMRLHDKEATIFITSEKHSSGDASSHTGRPLAEVLDTFVPPQLISRVTLPLVQTTGGPVGLGAAPSLREVDTYMENLHDCWRRSVELNVSHSQSDRTKGKELKQLREDLNHHRTRCAKVEEELRLHTLDSDDYNKEYATLKQELDNYLRTKGRLD
ncbi:Hypothetical protein, putative [Bodo saltans]|uniref:GAF domain-containing protein n=1 Tax=Bodo saltans TaxID=75058 RepID=A0A0S4JPJ4_BODSA|nr:Hypothetical protein, putative [Bodo saltans]|eukprot:CUG91201.1 Hypothetical protein, putative [Bodo saltans]